MLFCFALHLIFVSCVHSLDARHVTLHFACVVSVHFFESCDTVRESGFGLKEGFETFLIAGFDCGFKATLARASSSDKKDAAALVAGVKVRHPKFGEGMVVSVRGEGAAKVVNVSFAGLGIKSLSAQLAPLTIIEK